MTREAGRARPVEDDTLDGLTPPVAGAELDAERQADVSMLRTALSDLGEDDRQILLDRHVHDKAVTDIATGLGVRPHAVTMRLRRAEERLAGAFAAAHAEAVNEPECRTTRAAMHDYLKGRLLPRRQRHLEVHMDGCTECTRAFIDVREVPWMLRDLRQHFIGGAFVTGTVGGAGAGVTAGAGFAAGTQPRTFGKKETSVAAGVIAVLTVGGAAAAYLGNQNDQPTPQAIVDLGGGGAAPMQPPAQDLPPSIPPADPEPRPATTPKEAPALEPVTTPRRDAAEPAPAAEPEAQPRPGPEPAPEPVDVGPEPESAPADPPAEPAPEETAAPPAFAPEPEAEPEAPPTSSPPEAQPMSGPPGNPGNDHGKGPTKDNGQGPGNGRGHGPGKGPGNGHGNGKGPGNGHGNSKGPTPNAVDAERTDLGGQPTSLLALPSIAGTPGVLLLDGLHRR
ncbi:zf-HC2 domain-containing protein [Promicromonospora soli]